MAVPADPSNPENWPAEYKFIGVLESAALDETELSESCRAIRACIRSRSSGGREGASVGMNARRYWTGI